MTEYTSHSGGEQSSGIPRRSQPGPASLSAAQKRIWLLHQFDPESPVWNRPVAARLIGDLDRAALASAVNEIVRRHEVLRTVFRAEDGEPRQLVIAPAQLPLEFEDLRGLAPAERESLAARLAAEESLRTFDLATGPMLRMKLLQLDARDHVLLVLMHHIVFDGWSEIVFLDELNLLYRAFADQQVSPLPETPIQYADFAVWQEQRWREGAVDRNVQYWRKQLGGAPAMLTLPADGEPSESERYRGESRSIVLSPELAEQLKQFSRQERASLFMTLLMTFQLLLARHCDQEEVVVGVPIAGRTRIETEKLIGCFMNVLVFRGNFSGDPKVREFLAQTRQSALEAFANQEVPFEKLVEELRPERRPDQWPMFQVMFQLRNLPPSRIGEAGNLTFEPFEFDRGVNAGLDLSLEIQEAPSGLRCSMACRMGLLRGATMEAMLERFRNLLEAVVSNPEHRVWTLPMLAGTERRRLLVECNDTGADLPRDVCVHQLVERHAEKTPDAIAVSWERGSLTYGELNCRANQVASHLQNLGVQPETLVGICVERSPEMVAGLLGILKAGGAYVPLDPSYPSHLLASLIADARLRILLTKREAAKNVPVPVEHLVYLDADWPELSRESEREPNANVRSDNLAYVLYTSGSTGSPKGVMVCHASVCNHLFWQESYFPRGDMERLLQRTPYTFDLSVWEIFGALTMGGRLVLAEQGREFDNEYLIDLIVEHRITAVCFVPSQLDIFLQDPRVRECTSLRCVVSAGEALAPHVHDRFFSLLDATLYNGYGPTEATVACTYFTCERGKRWPSVPIGRPIANTQIYIVDRCLEPVPAGVRGELCVAGAGVARGYLNRPELTAEKFVPDPFNRAPGTRLYRTGDLARYLPDGNIEFLGRADNQVKIRGCRVELGEVEAVLSSHPDVRAAAVVARDGERGDKQLVAYVDARQQVSPTINQLRAFVGGRLPAYMQPARWVFLDAMPLSSSGKINRRALPEPGDKRPAEVADYCAPGSPVEETMARIWAKTLNLDRVGIRDDFFELGGHSLLAVSLFAAIKREFGTAPPLSALLEAPTVEQLSRLVAAKEENRRGTSLIPIRTGGTRPPLFCIHAANGRVLMYGGLARHLGADQPVYALQSAGLDGGEQPLERVEQMASRYLTEIRAVQPHGPYHLVGFCLGALIAFEMARQLAAEGEELGLLAVVSHDAGWRGGQSAGADLRRHFDALRRLGPSHWPAYLARRLRYRATRLRSVGVELLRSLYTRAGHPLPMGLRELHVGELNHRAGLAYKPPAAPLCLHYFQGSEDLHKEGAAFWTSIATAGVKVDTVPGWGSRMFREPNVRILAEKLAASQNV